jgi:putative toxin-antitoxin system antitoxin component (TIGR02293 family)
LDGTNHDDTAVEWGGVERSRAIQLDLLPQAVIDRLESELDLNPNDIADALSVDRRTVERWRTGQTFPQHDARRRLADLWSLRGRLRSTFSSPEAASRWLHEPSRYLGGLTPMDALHAGRFDRVEAALDALDSGVFL